MKFLIWLQALSNCYTVPMMFGIGKSKASKAWENWCRFWSCIAGSCYICFLVLWTIWYWVIREYKDHLEKKNWKCQEISKSTSIKSLPPIDEALKENINQAHFTAALWKKCASGNLPPMNPCDYGWEKVTKFANSSHITKSCENCTRWSIEHNSLQMWQTKM